MGRTLSLICITAIISSAQTRSSFDYRQEPQVVSSYENLQIRQSVSENVPTRSQEDTINRIVTTPQESTIIEYGSHNNLHRHQISKRDTGNKIKLIIPEECKLQGYCENVGNYPVDLVKKIVHESLDMNEYDVESAATSNLGPDRLKSFSRDEIEGINITQRNGNGPKDVSLCLTKSGYIQPKAGIDKNGKWYVVLNLENEVLQRYKVEKCEYDDASNPERTCSSLVTVLDIQYQSKCVQNFMYRVAEVIDSDGVHRQIALRLPSCCSCVLVRNQ